MDANTFLDILDERDERDERGRTLVNKLATIQAGYTSGAARVTFDGEETLTDKAYTYLAPYAPVSGHRVLMVPVGSTYVIMGRVLP